MNGMRKFFLVQTSSSRLVLHLTTGWKSCSGWKTLSTRPCSSATRASSVSKTKLQDGPGLAHFMNLKKRPEKVKPSVAESHEYLTREDLYGNGRKVLFVTYGCQMNVNDTEIVRGILVGNGYVETRRSEEADVILLMTCSIREGAEDKIWRELRRLKSNQFRARTVGVLGCMAERVRDLLLEKGNLCQVVAGPDAYRDLPRLLAVARYGQKGMNVQLSLEETYADVSPVRPDAHGKSAYVSIMRGCDNMCTYCIVPFTRGRERSRAIDSILAEVRQLSQQGFKQVILLGQNVNSYRDTSESTVSFTGSTSSLPGFKTVYGKREGGRTFVTLLDQVSRLDPEMRIRFTSPHPKDFPLEVLELIRDRPNICNQLHLPAQSGDSEVLAAMGRGYTREAYLRLVEQVRSVIPGVALTSDFIAGFCGESQSAHENTVSLIKEVGYSFCYVFPYSMREGTRAHRKMLDDVPSEEKARRHLELAAVFREKALELNKADVGSLQLVLVEGESKRSPLKAAARNDKGVKVVIEKEGYTVNPGDYVVAQIREASSQTLQGRLIRFSSIQEFQKEEREKSSVNDAMRAHC